MLIKAPHPDNCGCHYCTFTVPEIAAERAAIAAMLDEMAENSDNNWSILAYESAAAAVRHRGQTTEEK